MKIGIIGSGMVGVTLANGFIKHGYETKISSQQASKYEDLKQKTPGASVGSFSETAAWADLIVLATKGSATLEVISICGLNNLSGKTVIDTTNPIADLPPQNGVLRYFSTIDLSLMEQLQSAAPDAHFVKCFNSVGNAFMVNPDFGGNTPSMFICGNNKEAKVQVKNILDQFGWEAEDMGSVEAARAVESLCILWCIPGFLENRWNHAFKLLKQ